MNTDEHGYVDSLTERVLAAVFEVSNTLGAGFLAIEYGFRDIDDKVPRPLTLTDV